MRIGDEEKVMKPFTPLTRKQDRQPVRYLVVDDSVFARKSLAKMIDTFGGELAGEAGERIVRQHPEARIVMVSSVGYQDNILAALQKGARHFVQKPVKPDVLYEIIRYVLNDDGVPAPAGVGEAQS